MMTAASCAVPPLLDGPEVSGVVRSGDPIAPAGFAPGVFRSGGVASLVA
jgi:hypothetical protein